MLSRLFRKSPVRQQPAIPDGQRVYAVGDIHGRLDLLDELLAMVAADDAARGAADTMLVLLGDLVDRGADSRGVVERAKALKADYGDKVRVLIGNHEEAFLGAATGDERAVRFFTRIGGRETILSYGMPLETYRDLHMDELAEALPRLIPADHIAFLQSLEEMVIIGDYAFVHAGIKPGVPLAEQSPKDLRWIREPFLDDMDAHEKFIIHGHTITRQVDEQPNRIGIDTGAYATGRLTAIGLEGQDRWYLQTMDPDRDPA